MRTIILSGGSGSRLWPMSTSSSPKPFIKIKNDFSLLQEAFMKAIEVGSKGIINVTNKNFFHKIQNEWEKLPSKNILTEHHYILEPFGRGTTASIAAAVLLAQEKYGNEEILLVLPSDQLISNSKAFIEAISEAKALAAQERIVTLGINPNSLETSYGYIKTSGNKVKKFIEKPSLKKVKEYVASGDYLWNSAILCFKVKTMLTEMLKYCPDIINNIKKSLDFCHPNSNKNILTISPECFKNVRDDTIDYSIMEKSKKISIVKCDIGWYDVGDWNRLSKVMEKDACGNVIRSYSMTEKVHNCYIDGKTKPIAAIGVENLIIVDGPDALLVANRDYAEDVKEFYANLQKSSYNIYENAGCSVRSWGNYSIIDNGKGFKIKRIEVMPGKSLSLQSHNHRSEHWIVVAGKATVINDDREFSLGENDSTYIESGTIHRLSNPSDTENLVVIEVQTGSYLEEDDIERFDENLFYDKIK